MIKTENLVVFSTDEGVEKSPEKMALAQEISPLQIAS